jgi:hypothetical protein
VIAGGRGRGTVCRREVAALLCVVCYVFVWLGGSNQGGSGHLARWPDRWRARPSRGCMYVCSQSIDRSIEREKARTDLGDDGRRLHEQRRVHVEQEEELLGVLLGSRDVGGSGRRGSGVVALLLLLLLLLLLVVVLVLVILLGTPGLHLEGRCASRVEPSVCVCVCVVCVGRKGKQEGISVHR